MNDVFSFVCGIVAGTLVVVLLTFTVFAMEMCNLRHQSAFVFDYGHAYYGVGYGY